MYSTWKKVDVGDGKKRMKIIETSKVKSDFTAMIVSDCKVTRNHIDMVKNQYAEIQNLKESLSEKEIVVQMDFSENYTCSNISKTQGAYWNPTMVTLHPVVLYYNIRRAGTLVINGLCLHKGSHASNESLGSRAAMCPLHHRQSHHFSTSPGIWSAVKLALF